MANRTIMFVTSHASRGGTLDYIRVLKQRFEIEGYDVRVISLYRGNSGGATGVDLMVDRERLRLRDFFPLVVRFVRACRALRPVAIFGVMPLANFFAAGASRMCGACAIATHHSPVGSWTPICAATDPFVANLGLYDHVICVSSAVAASFGRVYRRRLRERIKIITNGVSIMIPARDASDVRKSLGLSDQEAFILMVGRLAEQKNVITAARAAQVASGVRLVLAGDGPLRADLEKLSLSKKIILLGEVNRQAVADLVYACDAFMQVSFYEGHSLALLEAIRAGRPLIVSDVPTQVEAVRMSSGQLAALVCDPFDEQAIARAMASAVFDRGVREDLLKRVESLARGVGAEKEMLGAYSALISGIYSTTR